MHSEKFVEYAEEKLKLMQFLKLSKREKIELLADGVKEPSLRRFALNARVNTIPEFIDYIRKITEDDAILVKRREFGNFRSRPIQSNVSSDKLCTPCKKRDHLVQECRMAKITCFKCKQVGHYSSTCPTTKTEPRGTLNHMVQEESTEPMGVPEPAAASSVHMVENGTPYIGVRNLGHRDKVFCALVDTGSPISLVRKSIYEKFLGANKLQINANIHLKGINNLSIKIYGKICDQINLDKLGGYWFDVILLVVDDNTIAFDMLLERDFFRGANIRLVYQNGKRLNLSILLRRIKKLMQFFP